MPLFNNNNKKKLTDYYFIDRIFDQGTYRLAHSEQREDHGSGREATKETNLRSGCCVKARNKLVVGKNYREMLMHFHSVPW